MKLINNSTVLITSKSCVPCEGGVAKMTREEAEEMLKQIPSWVIEGNVEKLSKSCTFNNFIEAIVFANKITPVAQREGHHPDLCIGWGYVHIKLSTHAIKGLSENDFILAAKIDKI